eukprot:TRINITY_DN845_c0_g1_i4.p1 TRINITY_DN845_c0_g1~~TRINITY_DN845_c0_g1_i4.p1  ORF type:complete len:234 (-),score=95.21 TRINITY_DN845_c0_g1_i4:3-704(-)
MSVESAVRKIKIAIDGPAGSGKSTTAREVAKRLGYLYIDSGAMYRAVALKVYQNNISPSDKEKVSEIAQKIDIQLLPHPEKTKILIDGVDASEDIRKQEIVPVIGQVAAIPAVREVMVKLQQKLGENGGIVMDGRDIGTVVFPNAELKLFMLASPEERAKRRLKEYQAKGNNTTALEEVLSEIVKRDKADEQREVGPLKKADDAIEVDTTQFTLDEQNQHVHDLAVKRIKELC